jgi:regulatory protein
LFVQDKRELEQWGRKRIKRGLLARGIERELVDAAIEQEGAGGDLDRALDLLRGRFPSPPRERRERDRALGVLLRKGYDSELALEALASYAREPG